MPEADAMIAGCLDIVWGRVGGYGCVCHCDGVMLKNQAAKRELL